MQEVDDNAELHRPRIKIEFAFGTQKSLQIFILGNNAPLLTNIQYGSYFQHVN